MPFHMGMLMWEMSQSLHKNGNIDILWHSLPMLASAIQVFQTQFMQLFFSVMQK